MESALPCQRALFEIDAGICYLDSAAISAIPRATRIAGQDGVARKSRPWSPQAKANHGLLERVRGLAASVVHAQPDDIALVCSVSYGIATAAANIKVPPGSRLLLLRGDHSSQTLTWIRYADEHGAEVEYVEPPDDGDWTSAVLAAIHRPGAAPVSIAALCPVIWTDGAAVRLAALMPVLRQAGAVTVVDATQAVGVLPIDVRELQPDFLLFPSYKWLLGPYTLVFLYAARGFQNGRPLEQSVFARSIPDQTQADRPETFPYASGARRYDMGERDRFVAVPTAIASLELRATWGQPAIAQRLGALTERLAGLLEEAGMALVPKAHRSPHILGVRGLPPAAADAARAADIFVSSRRGILRISPHVYNDEADIDRCARFFIDWRRGAA